MGAPAPPVRRKKIRRNSQGKFGKCTRSPPSAYRPGRARVNFRTFLLYQGDLERELLVLEATTKKVVTTF